MSDNALYVERKRWKYSSRSVQIFFVLQDFSYSQVERSIISHSLLSLLFATSLFYSFFLFSFSFSHSPSFLRRFSYHLSRTNSVQRVRKKSMLGKYEKFSRVKFIFSLFHLPISILPSLSRKIMVSPWGIRASKSYRADAFDVFG